MIGKVMTREEVDALETDFSHWEVSSYSALLKLLLRLIATVREREAQNDELSKMLTAGSNKILELQLASAKGEQAEAERDRLREAVHNVFQGHRHNCLTYKHPYARCTCGFEEIQKALTPTDNADAE